MTKYLRSEEGTRFVSLGKIKEFALVERGFERWVLKAYMSESDHMNVRTFKTKEEGQSWLELYLAG